VGLTRERGDAQTDNDQGPQWSALGAWAWSVHRTRAYQQRLDAGQGVADCANVGRVLLWARVRHFFAIAAAIRSAAGRMGFIAALLLAGIVLAAVVLVLDRIPVAR
jgi:hypothetical protein